MTKYKPFSNKLHNIKLDEKSNKISNKILIVMGNGPSLKFANFDLIKKLKIDCFGLNNAFRAYDKINFWPKYFGCFDTLIIDSNKDDYQKLIDHSPIDKFFFSGNHHFKNIDNRYQHIDYRYGRTNHHPFNVDTNSIASNFDKFWIFNSSSATAVHCGIVMGYNKILLLGVDEKYIDYIDECEKDKKLNEGLVIKKTPKKNPNYWFNEYQIKGDRYHVPNVQTYHLPEWKRLATLAKQNNIDIINCTPGSKVKDFTFSSLEHELLNFL